ncbi:DUF3265 domain-containing protein, partial [Vibrio parahaemolyticus]|nr:DUF3265 domain-containing protein [Vibrio parahaemolyticus]
MVKVVCGNIGIACLT